jgi:hypothetical protein
MTVENTGNTNLQNAVFRVKLPPEYRDRNAAGIARIQATSDASGDQMSVDQDFNVNYSIPLLSGGQRREYEITIPNLPPQGYTMACSVLVNGASAAENTTVIRPD